MMTWRPVDGFDRELHVRSAGLDTDPPDAGDRRVAHLLVLDVGECLLRRHGDRVAGVHTHRVDVLDRADDHAVVGAVAHHLELVLLPSRDRLLDEDLADRARRQPIGGHPLELVGVGGDAGAASTEDVRGTDDHWQPDVGDDLARLVHVAGGSRTRHIETDLDHRRLELLAILGGGDRRRVGTDHLRAAGHADQPALVQLHRHVQPGLAAERGQHGVGMLAVDDRLQHLPRQRFDVGRVGEVGIGHDRRRIRVGEDDAIPLVTQHATRLRPRVVEFARLTDHDRARPDDEDRVDVGPLRHQARTPPSSTPPSSMAANCSNRYLLSCGPGPASG